MVVEFGAAGPIFRDSIAISERHSNEHRIRRRTPPEAMRATGLTMKNAVVEQALSRLVNRQRGADPLKDIRGPGSEGKPDAMRAGLTP